MSIRKRFLGTIFAHISCLLLLGLLPFCLDSAARAQSIESNTATYPGGGLLGANPFKAPPKTEAEKKRDEDDWTIKISNAPKYADAGWSYIYYHTKDPKRFQKAWGYFEQSINCDKEYIDAYYGRGLAKMLLEQLPEALEDFDFVLSKEPGRERTRSMRAYVRAALAQYGDEVALRAAEQELRAAEQDMEKTGITEHKSLFYRAAQGMIAAARGDCSGAVTHLSWAIEHGFDTWTCRGTRANAYMHLRDYPRAIADIEHEIKKHPSWRGPHRSLGACHAEMGKPELALADYANELKLDPDNLGVLFERFSLAIESGKPEASLEDLGRLIARHPNHPYALASRGLVRWLTHQDSALVKADLDQAIKLYPREWTFHAIRAAFDYKQGDYAHALGDATRCCLVMRRTEFRFNWQIEYEGNGHGWFVAALSSHPEGADDNEEKNAKRADLEHRLAELSMKVLWTLACR